MVPLFTLQKQTNRTSATLPTTATIRPARVNEGGERSYWTLATFLQIPFRCPRTISSYTPQSSAAHRGWRHNDRRPFDIPIYTNHSRATVTTTSPIPNTITAERAAAYTASTTNSALPSGRCADPGPDEDGTSRADCWGEIDERCHKEETKEGERFLVVRRWRRRCPWCREWVGRRRNERSYQYEHRERWGCSADGCRASARECWRNHRCDAGVDHGSSWNTRTYTSRCTSSGEEARWTREGEEGENVRSCFEGCHRHGVMIVFLLQVVFPQDF